MTIIIQIILVTVILACMVMVLLSIGRLAKGTGFDDADKTRRLREDVKGCNEVITDNSVFDYLLVRRESSSRNSENEPVSRME